MGRQRHHRAAARSARRYARATLRADDQRQTHSSPLARQHRRDSPRPRRRVGARVRRSRVARVRSRPRHAVVLRDVRRCRHSHVRRPDRRERVVLLAGRPRRHQPLGRRPKRRRRREARRANARRVRRRLSRRARKRERVRGAPRVLQADVREPATSAATSVWKQRLVLGVRKEQRRNGADRRAQHRRALSAGHESSVRGHRRRLATRSAARTRQVRARGIAATTSSPTCARSPARSNRSARALESGFVRSRLRPTRPTAGVSLASRKFLDPTVPAVLAESH